MKNINKWFWLGLAGIVLGSPNATLIKATLAGIDVNYFNFLRFGLASLATVPYLVLNRKKINRVNLKFALIAGLFFSVAVAASVYAIKLSNASYASLITLITPVFLIFYSVKFNRESVSRKSAAGIAIAATGAFVMVFLPIAVSGGVLAGQFYPLATALLLLTSMSYPIVIIATKKSNDAGLPIISITTIVSMITMLVSGALLIINSPVLGAISTKTWAGILYSGLLVGVMVRTMEVKAYEHIGSVVMSALGYLGNFLSILIPVLVLGEKLSLSMIAGGVLILLGIYIIEHHKSEYHKHFHAFRHH